MKLPFIKYLKYNFSYDCFQKQYIPPFYNKLLNYTNKEAVINKNFKSEDSIGNAIHEIKFIPSYFRLEAPLLSPKQKLITHKRVKNFRVNLEGVNDAEDYLEKQMSAKKRSEIRRIRRRLETCFNIKYTFYYGHITKAEYDFLFNQLESLIQRRFNQRGDTYSLNDKWGFIKADAYHLILEKKASLFVIYDENKPIDICLNYHYENIVQHLIRSYDIDYSKYGIGQTDIFKQIEWCILNNFKIFDLMWGELAYKKLWCNDICEFEHHFIFKNNTPIKLVFVKTMISFYKIIDTVKQKSIYKKIIKAKATTTQKPKEKSKESVIIFKNITKMPSVIDMTAININGDSYRFLRKTVYDFQYLNSENSNAIRVYKINNETNSYIIKGEKDKIKIEINNYKCL